MKFWATFLTLWIPFGKIRKRMRDRLLNRLYSYRVLRHAGSVGSMLSVRGITSVTQKTYIGSGVSLGGGAVYGGGKCTIGDHVHFGPEFLILTQNHNYEGAALPYDRTFVPKDVAIGDSVWIGARVTILPGTQIGEGSIVQAGSVVHGSIPACSIVGGNPAKVFASRNTEHYHFLKKEGRFYR